MGGFWDARAEENAFYFVDNRLAYRNPDLERFWADGEADLVRFLNQLGVSIASEDEVVEIGCGVGRLTRFIGPWAASVRALDVSAKMLEIAQEHNHGLNNVEWLKGDGYSLAGIESASADCCISHVVFQHIPDPQVTLGYVREIGRVLRPGGWAAFQISNDSGIHKRRPLLARVSQAARAAVGFAPHGQRDPRWKGSMVELDELRQAANEGAMDVERVVGEGTQMCLVLTRRR